MHVVEVLGASARFPGTLCSTSGHAVKSVQELLAGHPGLCHSSWGGFFSMQTLYMPQPL
jgi:hypothetical protein